MITPNHLLFGRRINLENISKSISFNNEDLNKRSQHLHNLLEYFRKTWRTEYLTKLRENQNCKVKDHECKIKEDEVVIICDDQKSRALLSVAKVEKVLLSKDNNVRGATIKYVINGKTAVINRPINKLYPIELMKQTSVDIQPKFAGIQKFVKLRRYNLLCFAFLYCYSILVYVYRISCAPGTGCCVRSRSIYFCRY